MIAKVICKLLKNNAVTQYLFLWDLRDEIMTVKELIEALSKFDGELHVVKANCEFGYDAVTELNLIEAVSADHGEAPYVSAPLVEDSSGHLRVLCLGPVESSWVESILPQKAN